MLHTIALHLIECTIHVRSVCAIGKLLIHDLIYHFSDIGHKNARPMPLQWIQYMYDNLLFGDFDTVASKVQLDDNYSAL